MEESCVAVRMSTSRSIVLRSPLRSAMKMLAEEEAHRAQR
jgi:hypothetical protein